MSSKMNLWRLGVSIMVAVVFIAGTHDLTAQTGDNAQGQPKSATSIDAPQNVNTQTTVSKDLASLPYYQYQGIQDLDQAKEAWIKDHPDQYRGQAANGATQYLKMEKGEMAIALSNAGISQIKGFIKEVLAEPMPTDYVLPVAVDDAPSAEQAGLVIMGRYPDFAGLSGEDFLQAIAHNPSRYIEMIREYKGVRSKYGSPYQAPQN